MKCISSLLDEHKTLLRALDVLDQIALEVSAGERLCREDINNLLDFLRAFGDDRHEAKEESALFPELLKSSAAKYELLRRMQFEHDQGRSLVEGLEDAVRTSQREAFAYYAGRLSSVLRRHICEEDCILFEIAGNSLNSEQDERIAADFNKFDQYGEATLQRLTSLLRHLEWKYLGRAA